MPRSIPTGGVELEEMLNDPAQMKAMFENGRPTAQFGEFIKAYAGAQMDAKTEISQQVRDETQKVLAEFMKGQKPAVPLNLNANPLNGLNPAGLSPMQKRNGLYNKASVGARLENSGQDGFTSWAEMLRATNKDVQNFPGGEELLGKLATHRKIQNSFGTIVPADGGFLVPETMRSDLLMIALENGIVRPRATVIPMEGWFRSAPSGLPWVPPSPNMPTIDTALVYPGTGLFEGTNLSEGRGTTRPFETIGAPYVDDRLVPALRACELPGVVFRRTWFAPVFSQYAVAAVFGVPLPVFSRSAFAPVRSALEHRGPASAP